MNFKELDTVVLDRDIPEHGLKRGDLGAVVAVYEPDGLEVEFVGPRARPVPCSPLLRVMFVQWELAT
jgi:hypothetical protein